MRENQKTQTMTGKEIKERLDENNKKEQQAHMETCDAMHIRDRDGTFPLAVAVDDLSHVVVVVACALVAALPLVTIIEHHGVILLGLDIDVDSVCRGRG